MLLEQIQDSVTLKHVKGVEEKKVDNILVLFDCVCACVRLCVNTRLYYIYVLRYELLFSPAFPFIAM